MGHLPPPGSLAAALILVGVLFGLRYWLALRRLTAGAAEATPLRIGFKPPQARSFGQDMEPNRRYAVRQYWQAAVFLAAGVCVFGWMLLTGQPITIGQGA